VNQDRARYPNVEQSINHLGLLIEQQLNKRFIVLSASSGTYTIATIIDRRKLPSFKINSIKIRPIAFVADKKTYFYETDNEDEVFYIATLINSNLIDEKIKERQTRGLFGAGDIGRPPLELPIPKFDKNDLIHKRLVELGKICLNKVKKIEKTKKLGENLEEVDDLTKNS